MIKLFFIILTFVKVFGEQYQYYIFIERQYNEKRWIELAENEKMIENNYMKNELKVINSRSKLEKILF